MEKVLRITTIVVIAVTVFHTPSLASRWLAGSSMEQCCT